LQDEVAANSQNDIAFASKGDMKGDDLGSRNKIIHAKKLVWYPAETDVSIRPGWFYHPEEDKKVKTADELMRIYFSSVGRNSVLLLNIPPDKKGLLSDADVKSLKGFAAKRNSLFGVNYADDAKIICSNGVNKSYINDDKYSTWFTTQQKDTSCVIEFDLKQHATFNVMMLQENISVGQRVEEFSAEYFEDGKWKKFAEGTTIGYKRLLQFDNVTTGKIRLTIQSSRLNPAIAELGLYKLAE
jgi:alpha-L-fucosidase